MTELRYVDQVADAAAGSPIGYDCTDQQGEQLGKVSGMIIADGTKQPQYLVVKTGGWFSRKRYVVPMDQVTQQDDQQQRLTFTARSSEAFEGDRFPEYDERWWQTQGQAANATPPAESGEQRLELQEERLRVGAEPYQAGTVRLSKQVVERQETLPVTLREEYLRLEFKADTGSIRVGDRELAAGETFDIPLFKERAVVHTEVVLREGVTVRKEVLERMEQVEGTLRREELTVDSGAEFIAGGAGAAAARPTDYTPESAQPVDHSGQAASRQHP